MNLQHVVVVLKLALGDLFNGEGRRDAHRRKHLRCSGREIAEMRQRQRQWAGTFCRIFKFFKRSSGNLADMSTCTAAVTRTSRLRASSTREMAQKPWVLTFLRETLPGCSASSSLRQATPSQQCSTCTRREKGVCET